MARREDDARFLKSEQLLVGAVAEEMRGGKVITIAKVCQRAGVFESTFYRHYHSLNEMVKVCENKLLEGFDRLINSATTEHLTMEKIFKRWAIFIYQNRDIFYLSVVADQLDLLMLMMKDLKPMATLGWRSSPQKIQQIYLIYSYEVIGVWLNWAEQEHFDMDKVSLHVRELSYLTKTAMQRLGGIMGDGSKTLYF